MEMPEITITEAYNLSQLKIAELERIVEALKAELKLQNEENDILTRQNEELKAWKKGAEHAKTELDLERIRLQDIIRDLEAKRDGLLDIIDKQHTASLSLCDKLDKALARLNNIDTATGNE